MNIKIRMPFTVMAATSLALLLSGCPENAETTTAAKSPEAATAPTTTQTAATPSISLPLDCTTDGEVGCVTNTSYKATKMSRVTAQNIKSGISIAGVTGTFNPFTAAASDLLAPLGFLSLDNYANLSAAHPWVDAFSRPFQSYLMIFILGANSSPSIRFKVQQAKDVLGGGNKDVPGKSFDHADSATGQRIFQINVRPSELDTANAYRFLRARVEVTGGTTTQITALTFGVGPTAGSADILKMSEVMVTVP